MSKKSTGSLTNMSQVKLRSLGSSVQETLLQRLESIGKDLTSTKPEARPAVPKSRLDQSALPVLEWSPEPRAIDTLLFSSVGTNRSRQPRPRYSEPFASRDIFDAGIGSETVLQSSTMESEVVFVRNLAQDLKDKNKTVYRHLHFYHTQKEPGHAKQQYLRHEKYLMDIAVPSANKLKPDELKTYTLLYAVKDREETPLFNFGTLSLKQLLTCVEWSLATFCTIPRPTTSMSLESSAKTRAPGRQGMYSSLYKCCC